MLDLLLLISTLAFIATGAVVGIRLLGLARRSRQLPDYLVGASLFVLAAIGYPLILWVGLGTPSLEAARWIFIASCVALSAGFSGVSLFTERVFRRGVRWAQALVAIAIGSLVYSVYACSVDALAAQSLDAIRRPDSPLLLTQLVGALLYPWTGIEGFLCWRQARMRTALGLADPLVANRFLLWAWVGLFSTITIVPPLIVSLLGGDGTSDPIARFSTALGGLASSVALKLAFLPSAAYRRWVERSARA